MRNAARTIEAVEQTIEIPQDAIVGPATKRGRKTAASASRVMKPDLPLRSRLIKETGRKAAELSIEAMKPKDGVPAPEVTAPDGVVGGGHLPCEGQLIPASPKNRGRKASASARSAVKPTRDARSRLIADPASHPTTPIRAVPDQQPNPADGGHGLGDPQRKRAPVSADLIDKLIELQRARRRFMKAEMRLSNQALAICRGYLDEADSEKAKKKAAVLYASVKNGSCQRMNVIGAIVPYLLALEPLVTRRAEYEKEMASLARQLPVWDFVKDVKGVAELSLAGLVGECGDLSNYATVSRIWKRLGLAVLDGGRQRRIAGDAAIEHGYNAQRRSLVWNIGECIVKAQWRGEKDGSPAHAIGPLGEYYGSEKAKQLAKGITPSHANNRAKRHMTKRFIRDLAVAWWRMSGQH